MYDGFKLSSKEGRIIYLNIDALTRFANEVKGYDAEKNREAMLMLLLELKQGMEKVEMQKKALQEKHNKAKRPAEEVDEGGCGKRLCNITPDLAMDAAGVMIPRNERGMLMMQRIMEMNARQVELKKEDMRLERTGIELKREKMQLKMESMEQDVFIDKKKHEYEMGSLEHNMELEEKKMKVLEVENKRVDCELQLKNKVVEEERDCKWKDSELDLKIMQRKSEETEKIKDKESDNSIKRKLAMMHADTRALNNINKPFGRSSCVDFDENVHMTIMTAYQKKREQYKLVRSAQVRLFLQRAGKLAKELVIQKKGSEPTQYTQEGEAEVLVYALADGKVLDEALGTIYRQMTSGGSQSTLNFGVSHTQ